MFTGLSFSFCVRDIAKGWVPFDQVDKIITATACLTPETWDQVIEDYKKSYWSEFPEECERIARQLIEAGKVEQPRLEGKEAHSIAGGHWLLDGKLFPR